MCSSNRALRVHVAVKFHWKARAFKRPLSTVAQTPMTNLADVREVFESRRLDEEVSNVRTSDRARLRGVHTGGTE